LKERREIECAGCKEFKPVEAGYFMNATINPASQILALTQIPTSRVIGLRISKDINTFEFFTCGDQCALALHAELMKKMSGDALTSPNGTATTPSLRATPPYQGGESEAA
jgi:hypothetical protein